MSLSLMYKNRPFLFDWLVVATVVFTSVNAAPCAGTQGGGRPPLFGGRGHMAHGIMVDLKTSVDDVS